MPQPYKNKASYAKTWINKFERVGDLIDYLSRFKRENNDVVYTTFKKHNLVTFEDVAASMFQKYELSSSEKIGPSDFIVGNKYSSHQILIFAKNYDTRSGGMFVLGNNEAMVIKATIKGGVYPNEWLKPHESLKYYLKSLKDNYSEKFKENAAVINTSGMPIYTFLREDKNEEFLYEGVYYFQSLHVEPDQSKWFELNKSVGTYLEVFDTKYLSESLAIKVEESLKDTVTARQNRLKVAPVKPTKIYVRFIAYKRNPDVVAEVLIRAKGICERCLKSAPFIRISDGSPYLEVHHKIQLANDGDDTIENSIALCPNCHRESHFGALL